MNDRAPRTFLAETRAAALLDEYSVVRPSEIELTDLAFALGIEVTYRKLRGAVAHLVRVGDCGGVTINSEVEELGRKRFALAHEIGHWVLHEGRTQLFLCTNENMADYTSSPEEIEANLFASALLIPPKMVLPQHRAVDPSLKLVQDIAERFNVSLTAAALRVVTKFGHPLILVFSKNGKITWWRRNEEFVGMLFFEKEQPLHPDSHAAHVALRSYPDANMQPVDWELWFPHLPRKGSLLEQSIPFPKYGTVMTLLWIELG